MNEPHLVIDDWRLYASCLGLDWKVFFPNRGESTQPAKAVCRNCIVRTECLDDAIYRKEPAGVRGGLATRERRKLVRTRRHESGLP